MVHAELTVAAVVEHDSHYLVIEEWVHGRRVVNQPAGHVEPGESIPQAVIRETLEESARHFTPTGFIGMYYWPHDDGRTTLRMALAGRIAGHDRHRALDDGIIRAFWLPRQALQDCPALRSPLVMQAIEDYEQFGVTALDRVRHITGDK